MQPCCLLSCCKRLTGLLPGEGGDWAQLKKLLFCLLFKSVFSSVSACGILLFLCIVPVGLLKAYLAHVVKLIELLLLLSRSCQSFNCLSRMGGVFKSHLKTEQLPSIFFFI